MVSGPPGSGKTTFGVQFLAYGARKGEVGLYVSLSEGTDTITEDMGRYDLMIPELIKAKRLVFWDMGPKYEYAAKKPVEWRGQRGPGTCGGEILREILRYNPG